MRIAFFLQLKLSESDAYTAAVPFAPVCTRGCIIRCTKAVLAVYYISTQLFRAPRMLPVRASGGGAREWRAFYRPRRPKRSTLKTNRTRVQQQTSAVLLCHIIRTRYRTSCKPLSYRVVPHGDARASNEAPMLMPNCYLYTR